MTRNLLQAFLLLLVASNNAFAADKRGPGIGDVPPKNWMTFDQLDVNHDGKVTADEFKAVEETAAQERFKKFDRDRDGRITSDEFLVTRHHKSGAEDSPGETRKQKQREPTFSSYDKDQSGALNRDEFDAAMLDSAAVRFERIDRNDDKIITRDELDAVLADLESPHRAVEPKRGKSDKTPSR